MSVRISRVDAHDGMRFEQANAIEAREPNRMEICGAGTDTSMHVRVQLSWYALPLAAGSRLSPADAAAVIVFELRDREAGL